MIRSLAALTATTLLTAAAIAHAAPKEPTFSKYLLECPSEAPSSWGVGDNRPLQQSAVLDLPTGQTIDDKSPPSLAPDTSFEAGKTWHNVWQMKDSPGRSHLIECRYSGTTRILRWKADGLQQCEQIIEPYDPKKGFPAKTRQSLGCE
jgi:hypothetical protein